MRVRVLFLQDVPPSYRAGEVSEVSGGYARNYLIPKGLAAPATGEQLKRIEKVKAVAEERRLKEAETMAQLAQALKDKTVTIVARVGEGGRLYGSITNMTIAEALTKAHGITLDRRTIHLPDPIREMGTFQVPIRLGPDLTVTLGVIVESEGHPAAAAAAPAQPEATQQSRGIGTAQASEETTTAESQGEADVRGEAPAP